MGLTEAACNDDEYAYLLLFHAHHRVPLRHARKLKQKFGASPRRTV